MDINEINPIKSLNSAMQSVMAHMQQASEPVENPAKWIYKLLIEYIRKFEDSLDKEHEIGARLVSFGHDITFHIQNIGYFSPNIITFYGVNENDENVQLIQNVTQLNVLLIALKKREIIPRRIGFLKDKEENNTGQK